MFMVIQLALYNLQTYEVGRNATTIFMTTDKVYTGRLGHIFLLTLIIKSLLFVK